MRKRQELWAIQTAFLGDCVLTLPALVQLAQLCPDAELKIVTGHAGKAIFELALERGLKSYRERIKIFLLDKRGKDASLWGLQKFASKVSNGVAPSAVFCFQRSLRSGLLAWFSNSHRRLGFATGAASFFYTQTVPREWSSGKSEIEKNLDLLRAYFRDRPGENKQVDIWNQENRLSLLASPLLLKKKKVGLALGSPWATKRWPVENAIVFAKRLCAQGEEVVLLGDESAVSLAQKIKSEVPSLLLEDLCGKTSISAWVDQIASLKLLVSNDSAAVHVASDLGVPVVALFGPTLPEFGFAPWRKNSLVLGLTHLECRPCGIHGPKSCPLKHHKCLVEISGETVANTVQAQLRRLNERAINSL